MMGSTTIEVPTQYRDHFKHEAAFTLECAADTVHDDLAVTRKYEREPDPLQAERAYLRAASDLWEQVTNANGMMHATGDRKVIADTVQGCVLKVGDAVHSECEKLTQDSIRERIAELEFWLSELDRIEAEAS